MLLPRVLKKFVWFFYILLLVFSEFAFAESENKTLEYKVKAAYLYNFTKFVSWPEQALSAGSGESLKICILGEDPFGHSIDLLKNKTARGHQVDVLYLSSVEEGIDCHVMFIGHSEKGRLDEIFQAIGERHILTVSDIEGFAIKGGCIKLEVVNGKVRFSINVKTVRRAQLEMSAKLLELARVVIE